jgi:DNA-binding MarR family transcriptional regulator
MRPKYNAVLRYLDEGGTRATVLAERSGLTRQALSQIVDELEAAGYVTRRPDPGDRRAKLVVYTERGLRSFRDSRRIIAQIEADYERRLGRTGYRQLRAALAALAEP